MGEVDSLTTSRLVVVSVMPNLRNDSAICERLSETRPVTGPNEENCIQNSSTHIVIRAQGKHNFRVNIPCFDALVSIITGGSKHRR